MSASIVHTSRHSERQRSCCYLIFCRWRSSFVKRCSLISTTPQAMPVVVRGYVAVPSELCVALLTPFSLHVQPSQCRITVGLISRDTGLPAPSPGQQHQRVLVVPIAKRASARCWGHVATPLQLSWVLWGTQGSEALLCVMKLRFYSGICCVSLSSHVKLCILQEEVTGT